MKTYSLRAELTRVRAERDRLFDKMASRRQYVGHCEPKIKAIDSTLDDMTFERMIDPYVVAALAKHDRKAQEKPHEG
jgi:hypothetical protein